jgi:hypothetical protein
MKTLIATLAIACGGAFAASAFAADSAAPAAGAASGALAAACHDDLQKYCDGVQPGEGRYKACMKEHWREFSPECKKALKQARRARKSGAAE